MGNTIRAPIRAITPGTHPRLHGEYKEEDGEHRAFIDSPPFARGIPKAQNLALVRLRLTPAYTGNTALAVLVLVGRWTHPRLHGEYTSYPGLILASSAFYAQLSPKSDRYATSPKLLKQAICGPQPSCRGLNSARVGNEPRGNVKSLKQPYNADRKKPHLKSRYPSPCQPSATPQHAKYNPQRPHRAINVRAPTTYPKKQLQAVRWPHSLSNNSLTVKSQENKPTMNL